MELTEGKLKARREQLVGEQQQMSLDYAALGGAIQDIDYWLAQLAQQEIPNASE